LIVAYLAEDFVIDQSVFIARFYDNSKLDPKSIMSILGSKLMAFYFRFNYSEFDDLFPKVKLQHFKSFPISENLINVDLELGTLSNEKIKLQNQLQKHSQKFQRTIQRKFNLTELSTKLENWYSITYKEFIAELTKKKIKLSLAVEAEWEEYFLSESHKAQAIKAEIDQTDKEIDNMVYALYGLTEDEIRIVEGK
jgi:ATP-dependent Lon protease